MGIATKSGVCHVARLFFALAATVFASACDVSGFVEGIVDGHDFTVRDDRPDLRPQHDDAALVVLAEQEWGTLRVVSLHIPAFSTLEESQVLDLGLRQAGGAWVEVAQGPIDESVRSDGVTVLNTLSPTFVRGQGGTAALDLVDGVLMGTLRTELEDGGWLEGTFEVEVEAAE